MLVPLVQCFGKASKGNVSILPVLVLVLCLYHCTVCTVLVPLEQCFGMASTGNEPFLLVLVLDCACTLCTVLWHGQHGQCTYLARGCACTHVPCLYHCTMFWYGQPGQCTYVARLRELLDRAMIFVFQLDPCTCSATHTDMDSLSLGDASIARWFEIVRCTCTGCTRPVQVQLYACLCAQLIAKWVGSVTCDDPACLLIVVMSSYIFLECCCITLSTMEFAVYNN